MRIEAMKAGVLMCMLEESAPKGSRLAAGVVGSVHFGGGRAGVCEIGPAVRAVMGVLSALGFGLGVWPGTCVRSMR